MDNLIIIGTLFAELLAMMICWYSLFKQEIKFDFPFLIVIAIEIIVMFLLCKEKLPRYFSIIEYTLLWVYFKTRFKLPIRVTTIKYIYGIAISGLLEIAILCVSILFQKYIEQNLLSLIGSWIMLFVMNLISTRITSSIIIFNYKNDKKIQLMIFFYVLIELIYFLDLTFRKTPFRVSMMGVGAFIFVGYIYLSKIIIVNNKYEKVKRETELNKEYETYYSDLLLSVRKRQHDFKNQLSAIYGMNYTASSLEELTQMNKNYSEMLIKRSKHDSILTCCNNKILAGYLYNRCINFENEGINIDCDLVIDTAECVVPIYELIETIGILIDNAGEELRTNKHNTFSLSIKESYKNIEITVSNPAAKMSSSEIDKLFKSGISTKGEGRGLGLARLKEIAQNNNASIVVRNIEVNVDNWLSIKIVFKK